MTDIRFLRLPDVRAKVGLSRSQIYRMIRDGAFPAPLKIGAQVAVWPEADITGWQLETLQRAGRSVAADDHSTIS